VKLSCLIPCEIFFFSPPPPSFLSSVPFFYLPLRFLFFSSFVPYIHEQLDRAWPRYPLSFFPPSLSPSFHDPFFAYPLFLSDFFPHTARKPGIFMPSSSLCTLAPLSPILLTPISPPDQSILNFRFFFNSFFSPLGFPPPILMATTRSSFLFSNSICYLCPWSFCRLASLFPPISVSSRIRPRP